MIKNILCGIAILAGLALFFVDAKLPSQLANFAGMALIGIGLFALGGGSADESDHDDGQISAADRVRNLQNKEDAA